MRYSDLHIETRREAPARARNEAEALLLRAGYLNTLRAPTALGERTLARLQDTVSEHPQAWAAMGRVITTSRRDTVIEGEAGDLGLLVCRNCDYADSQETARRRAAPPGAEAPLPLERVATPNCHTIESLAAFLGIPPAKTAKALLYVHAGTDDLVFVVVRGDMQASETKLQSFAGPLQVASQEQIIAAGAVPGYASPLGLTGVEVILDEHIPASPNLVAGANEEGFHILNTNYGRDYNASSIGDITLAQAGDACPDCGAPLHAARGHIVSDLLGIRPLGALLCLAEKFHDERGLTLPFGMSAFGVYLLHLPSRDGLTAPVAQGLHASLESAGVSVLYDDRDERAGVKFNDADLIGCPVRITVGEKHLNDRMVELKARSQSGIELTLIDAVLDRIQSLAQMKP